MSVFMIADTHFCHHNIIKYCNRPFENIEDMNDYMITKWNQTVSNEDVVYMLGDFCLGNEQEVVTIGQQLRGKKILLKGNHDPYKTNIYIQAGFNQIIDKPIIFANNYILSHYPFENIPLNFYNICGHTHPTINYDTTCKTQFNVGVEANDYKPVKFERIQKILKKNN